MIARRTNQPRRFPGLVFLVTLFCVTAEPLFGQTTIYVDANSTDPTHDGSSWCDAYKQLDDALSIASSGDTIKVADGEYSPDPTGLTDPRDATFQLVSGVTILGGYAGCGASNPDDRDPQQYESKLTGDLSGDDASGTASDSLTCGTNGGYWYGDVCDSIDANGNRPTSQSACETIIGATWYPAKCSIIAQDKRDDNVYHVLTADKTVTSGTLDGLTVTGGNAQTRRCYDTTTLACTANFCVKDLDCASGEKCGDCCKGGSNDDNFCTDGEDCADPGVCFGFPSNIGAGLYNVGGQFTINNCMFTVNYADFRGGGLMNLTDQQANPPVPGDLTLTNTDFVSNRVIDNGAGLYNGADTVMDPTTCNFVGNVSETSGGGVCNRRTQGTWINCKFIGNEAKGGSPANGGGGLFNASSSPTLTDCEFYQNSAVSGGGGIWNEKDFEGDPPVLPSSPLLTDCDFVENSAGSSSGTGGGGMWNQDSSSPSVVGCTFRGNQVADGLIYGGAMWNQDAGTQPLISGCVFVQGQRA